MLFCEIGVYLLQIAGIAFFGLLEALVYVTDDPLTGAAVGQKRQV
jgi:hypothetical protein